jgi:hypothetical protein
MTHQGPPACRINVLAGAIRRVVNKVTKVIKRAVAKVPKIRKIARSPRAAHSGKFLAVDVTTIPKVQLSRLMRSDAPEDAPGLRRMVAESRRTPAK